VYKYFAFGLSIESEIYFPELFSGVTSLNTDVQVKIGAIESFVQFSTDSLVNGFVIDQNYFYLNIPGIGKYYATSGNLIIIEPLASVDREGLRLYCLSNVFSAILFQRKIFPLHAAAIKIQDHLVLICGHSGAGKSTLLASLLSKGYKIFSDDVCVPFIASSGKVYMHSSYPMMKFWKDTLLQFPYFGEPNIHLRPDYDKYGIFFHNDFEIKALVPNVVFFLGKSSERADLHLREIKGIELFQKLESNAYRGEYLGVLDLKQSHFELFTSLANQLNGYVIERPEDYNTIEEVTNKVEEIISIKF
jgi:energy-coupling factor transporter ATP-binding protein EcfA2